MDNFNLPAFPIILKEGEKYSGHSNIDGFTKLEYAALMITQGLQSPDDWQLSATNDKAPSIAQKTAQTAVMLAKAVLEEANK